MVASMTARDKNSARGGNRAEKKGTVLTRPGGHPVLFGFCGHVRRSWPDEDPSCRGYRPVGGTTAPATGPRRRPSGYFGQAPAGERLAAGDGCLGCGGSAGPCHRCRARCARGRWFRAGGAGFGLPARAIAPPGDHRSLLIVGLAAIAGVIAHHRAGHVHWRSVLGFGTAGIAGSAVGSLVAARLPPGCYAWGSRWWSWSLR
jgi:hypothetical protein